MKLQKKFLWAIISGLLFPGLLLSREIIPSPARTSAVTVGGAAPITQFVFFAGIMAGGKQNTCYVLRSRLTVKKFMMDGTAYFLFNGGNLYNANIGIGNIITFTAGVEFGDRTYWINQDSTFEHIKLRNTNTGEYAYYSQFPDLKIPQEIVSYNLGMQFNFRVPKTNFWRGVGESYSIVSFKWEMMFAPKIGYDNTMEVTTQGPYQAETVVYELEEERVRHFGFRMIMDSRFSSKIGWMMEFGIRPGLRYELNEENRFSNGYVRMGVSLGVSVGGRKDLNKPGFGREIPVN